MSAPARLTTEAEARPFYGRRVRLLIDGEEFTRTILPDDIPAGDGRTMGEYWDRVILKARTNAYRTSLRSTDIRIIREVER